MMGHTSAFVPTEQKTSIIQITDYQDKNFEGTLQNPYFPNKKVFSNLTQLLFLIENLQDQLQYPQKGMEPRRFKKEATATVPPQTQAPPSTVKATFKLHLLFRQNASWQGSITWVEDGTQAQFRSALELVTLMDSVLT